MLPSILLNCGLQFASAAIFVGIEGWGYGDAVYHCFVTATTVGYGDMSISSEAGQIWACFHILFSVVLLAEAIGSIGELQEDRRVAFERLHQMQRQLDARMLDGLLLDAAMLRSSKEDGASAPPVDSVNESEFVVCMLLQMEIAKMAQVRSPPPPPLSPPDLSNTVTCHLRLTCLLATCAAYSTDLPIADLPLMTLARRSARSSKSFVSSTRTAQVTSVVTI